MQGVKKLVYDSYDIFGLYRNLIDIKVECQSLFESQRVNSFPANNLRNVLEKLYILSNELFMEDISGEIGQVKGLFRGMASSQDIERLFNCLLRCLNHLEDNLIERYNVVIYSRNTDSFSNIVKHLLTHNCNVFTSNNEADIINTIKATTPQIIIIDNDASNNGLSLFHLIKSDSVTKKTPIVFIGPTDKDTKLSVLREGAMDCISKPFLEEELILKVKNITVLSRVYSRKSLIDFSLGICPKKYGEELSVKAFEEAVQKKEPLTVLIAELDDIKKVNILVGRSAYNHILKNSASIIKRFTKSNDIVYRHSDNRFIIVFPGKELAEVLRVSKGLQEKILSFSQKHGFEISFTGGIASLNSNTSSFQDLLKLAADSNIESRQDGNGKIYIHSTSLEKNTEKSILIVDSDKVSLSILTSRYKSKGYNTYSAEDGGNAVQLFKEKDVDLVITDFFIPGTPGDEFIKIIKKINSSAKILVLSAQKTENFVNMALKAGADDYITKPFSPVELDLRIQKFIG